MGFKLGTERGNYAVKGKVRTKFNFSKNSGEENVSVPGTPIIRMPLEEGVMGEANMDGSVYINENIVPGSHEETQTIIHEMKHATDIKIGKLEYGDYYIKYNGDIFRRETIEGKDMILLNGEWKEAGHTGFPWESNASNGSHKM